MLSSLRILWFILIPIAILPLRTAWAFQPPLTDVQASVVTNGRSVVVRCQVYDPAAGSLIAHDHSYPGNVSSYWVIGNLTVSTGIVAWVANAAGTLALRDREISYAVYDPGRRAWQERTHRYEGGSINLWTLSAPSVTNGVVLWQANGSGLVYAWDTEIGFATYDPLAGAWQAITHRYNGTDASYWAIANRQTAGGLVTWTRSNLGQFAVGHREVHYAIFDPLAAAWREGSQYYESHLNNPWSVSSQRIALQSLTWTATNRAETRVEARGYNQPQHLWDSSPTTATAAFAASTTAGPLPLSVWFTDLSIGATNWSWRFGDGTNVTTRSPLHTFQQPGTFVVTQTVRGPNGTSAAEIRVAVDTAAGWLAFDTPNLALSNGLLRLPVLGASGVNPVILYASTNLADWVAISTNPPQAEPFVLTTRVNTNLPGQFFRAVVPP